MKRRDFLKLSTKAAIGVAAIPVVAKAAKFEHTEVGVDSKGYYTKKGNQNKLYKLRIGDLVTLNNNGEPVVCEQGKNIIGVWDGSKVVGLSLLPPTMGLF